MTLDSYKGLQIIQYNVRSLFHKIDIVRHDFLMPAMDIICFSETWLNENLPDELVNLDGFHILRNDRRYGKGGGTCVYIRNRLHFENIPEPVSDSDVEIQGVNIMGSESPQPQKTIALIMVYRPPRGNSTNALLKIKDFIHKITHWERKEIVLLGDFNWNVHEESGRGIEYVQELETEFGITQIITGATRIGANSSSTIDLILTNICNVFESGCLIDTFSDHFPTFLVKRRAKPTIELIEIRKRKMTGYDSEAFTDTLVNLDWSVMDLLNDVNEMWTMIYKAILYESLCFC